MDMISKFQLGGGFESFFTTYTPLLTPRRHPDYSSRRSTRVEEDDKEDTKGKLTEKDLFTMLKDIKGLPNEMDALFRNFTNTLKLAKVTGSDGIQDLAINYIKNLSKLEKANYNRELFDEVRKKSVEKGNINDIAITLDGSVLALNRNQEIVSLRPEDWVKVKESGEYEALTNSNLLWYRSHHPGYVNNNKILLIVENGISLDEVNKMIKARFHEIGQTETSVDRYVPKEVMKGHEILSQMVANGPDGIYKITENMSKSDELLIKATLNYIYDTLPANAKTRLSLETKTGSKESIKDIIGTMILGTLDSKTSYGLDYSEDINKVSTSDTKESVSGFDATAPGMFLAGLGNKQSFVVNPGTSSAYIVNSNILPLTDNSDNPLGTQSTLLDASKGNYSGILNFNSVTMGGLLVDPLAFSHIILSDGKIASIDFPCINQDGVIIPKITPDIVAKKKEADSEIRRRGINLNDLESIKKNYLVINQIYQSKGLDPAYNDNGEPIPGSWARFGVINASASDKALKLDPFTGSSLLQEDNDEFNVQRYMEITKLENWDSKDYPSWLEGDADVLYKGTVWIPIDRDYVSAYIGKDIKMKEAVELDRLTLILDRTSSLTLGRLLQ